MPGTSGLAYWEFSLIYPLFCFCILRCVWLPEIHPVLGLQQLHFQSKQLHWQNCSTGYVLLCYWLSSHFIRHLKSHSYLCHTYLIWWALLQLPLSGSDLALGRLVLRKWSISYHNAKTIYLYSPQIPYVCLWYIL